MHTRPPSCIERLLRVLAAYGPRGYCLVVLLLSLGVGMHMHMHTLFIAYYSLEYAYY